MSLWYPAEPEAGVAIVHVCQIAGHPRRMLRRVSGADVAEHLRDRLSGAAVQRHDSLPELHGDRPRDHVVHLPKGAKHAAEAALKAVAGESAHVAQHLPANADHAGIEKNERLLNSAISCATEK